jgi:hypothetical protein
MSLLEELVTSEEGPQRLPPWSDTAAASRLLNTVFSTLQDLAILSQERL